MSIAREDWLRAHAALWYDDRRYRLAWLALPQAVTCAVAGLCMALAAQGVRGRPAPASKARPAAPGVIRRTSRWLRCPSSTRVRAWSPPCARGR